VAVVERDGVGGGVAVVDVELDGDGVAAFVVADCRVALVWVCVPNWTMVLTQPASTRNTPTLQAIHIHVRRRGGTRPGGGAYAGWRGGWAAG
jgi:hypothetical protein